MNKTPAQKIPTGWKKAALVATLLGVAVVGGCARNPCNYGEYYFNGACYADPYKTYQPPPEVYYTPPPIYFQGGYSGPVPNLYIGIGRHQGGGIRSHGPSIRWTGGHHHH